MKKMFFCAAVVAATPLASETERQLGAHQHGIGALNIAIEETAVLMELRAPGADIVGFEHPAKSEEHRAAIDAAVATLAQPLSLFVVPDAAGCSVTRASAMLETEEGDLDHDGHDHEDHADHDGHAHDDHAHEDHAHEDHAGHEAHDGKQGHTEFHAEYMLSCADPQALTEVAFAYFDSFANARMLEVQIVSASGAQAFEVSKEAPLLDLRSLY